MATVGIPLKLLNESQVSCSYLLVVQFDMGFVTNIQGHVVTIELTSGQTYRGKLLEGSY